MRRSGDWSGCAWKSEPRHLEALLEFAARAYRRPLDASRIGRPAGVLSHAARERRLTHEEAIRDSVVSILMSPNFCTGWTVTCDCRGGAARVQQRAARSRPLSGYALASRLSYFLWSSMPDQELLAHAAAGDLQKPEVLTAQARRMLKDDRAMRPGRRNSRGNWLDFRRFEEHNAVDRERFPSFTNELREAMFQEPVRLHRRRDPQRPLGAGLALRQATRS